MLGVCFSSWLPTWLIDWLTDWLIDWLTNWLIDWLTVCLSVCLSPWIYELLVEYFCTYNMIRSPIGLQRVDWLISSHKKKKFFLKSSVFHIIYLELPLYSPFFSSPVPFLLFAMKAFTLTATFLNILHEILYFFLILNWIYCALQPLIYIISLSFTGYIWWGVSGW